MASTGSDILKELFISLGWKYDESSSKKVAQAEHKTTQQLEKESKVREAMAKKARESLDQTLKTFAKFAAGAQLMAVGVVAAVESMASSFEKAYYQSSRTGSSVKEMRAFSYAASQMGSSAEEAMDALEGLGTAQRNMPGFGQMLRAMGASDPNNKAKSLTEIASWFARQPINAAEARAKVLGIPEHLMLAMRHDDEFRRYEGESDRKYAALGFDPEKAAKDGKELSQSFRSLYETIKRIGEESDSGAFATFNKTLKDLNAYLEAHGKQISAILWDIANALLSMVKYVVEHLSQLDNFAKTMGGWTQVFTDLGVVVTAAYVARFVSLFNSLRGIAALSMPGWALAILGVGAAGAAAYKEATDPYLSHPGANNVVPGRGIIGMRKVQEDRNERAEGPWGTVKRAWAGRPTWMGGNGRGLGGGPNIFTGGGWWTPERQKQAYDHLTAGGMPSESAIALISRWANVESTKDGPTAVNKIGAEGIAQWLGGRQIHNPDFNAQLDHVLDEYRTGSGDGRGVKASVALRAAKTARDAAIAASAYERAEGYNPTTGVDAYTGTTLVGMDAVRRNVQSAKAAAAARHLIYLTTSWPGGRGVHETFGKALSGMHAYRPIGGAPADHSRRVNLNQTNNVNVHGVADPTSAAAQIGARQDRHSSLLLREMQSAIV